MSSFKVSPTQLALIVELAKRSIIDNAEDATALLEKSIELPYDGTVADDRCHGVIKCGGLYKQCTKQLPKPATDSAVSEDNDLVNEMYICKACEKNIDRFGTIDERQEEGAAYTERNTKEPKTNKEGVVITPKVKGVIPYYDYLKKNNISVDVAKIYAEIVGYELTENDLVCPKKETKPRKPRAPKQPKTKEPLPDNELHEEPSEAEAESDPEPVAAEPVAPVAPEPVAEKVIEIKKPRGKVAKK